VPRMTLSRRISADPVSAALLLAGPAALDLAPGLSRVSDAHGHRVLAEAVLPPDPGTGFPETSTVLAVRAAPPRRTPTSYVTDFTLSGTRVASVTGRLELTAELGAADEPPATVAHLSLDYDLPPGDLPPGDLPPGDLPAGDLPAGDPLADAAAPDGSAPATPRQLELLAEGFLAGFAVAAGRRASAA
jgi:hypothetical protein